MTEETLTPEQMREQIMAAPDPLDGPSIWDRAKGDEGYEMAGNALAKAMLLLCEERPELLDVPSREDDPTGRERAENEKLWEAVKERWPGLNDWLGGVTGFQYGWAHTTVRYILGAEPVGNPAIMTLGKEPS